MHVGFITSHFPFPDAKSVGGIGTSMKNLADGLVKSGHKVSVFVYSQPADENLIIDGITIYKLKNIKLKGLSWLLTRKKIQKRINAVHKLDPIDIVESPDWEGISSFINTKPPIIIRLHGSDTYFCHLDGRRVKFKNKFHEKRALQKAKGIISVSRFTGEMTNKIFNLNKKFEVIPNGINIEGFIPSSSGPDKKLILYFGGIIRKKGLLEIPHYFNRVMEKHPDAKLVLIGADMPDKITGNASTYEMMLPLFSETAIQKVSFLGSVPHHEIRAYIEKAAVCIFPSFAEALPVSWLEAMAMEKAIVASDIGWANEMLDDRINGFLVAPKDHDSFGERICQLLEDENLATTFGNMARKKVTAVFSNSIVTEKSIAFYKNHIERGNYKQS